MAFDHSFLRKVSDPGSVVATQFLAGAVEHTQGAAEGRHEAEHSPAERRFSGTVRADDPDELSLGDFQRNVFESDDAGKSQRHVIKGNNRMAAHGRGQAGPDDGRFLLQTAGIRSRLYLFQRVG